MLSKISIKVEILFDGDRCGTKCPFLMSDGSSGKFCKAFGKISTLKTLTMGFDYNFPIRCQECLDYEKQNANLRSTEVTENEKNTSSS